MEKEEYKTGSKYQKHEIKIIAEKEYDVLKKKMSENDLEEVVIWLYVYEDIKRMEKIKKDANKLYSPNFGKKHEWRDYIIQGPILNYLLDIRTNSMESNTENRDTEELEESKEQEESKEPEGLQESEVREYKLIRVSKSIRKILKGLYQNYMKCPLIVKENLLKQEKKEEIDLQYQMIDLIKTEFEKDDLYQKYVLFNALNIDIMIDDENALYQYEKLYAFFLINEEINVLMHGIENAFLQFENGKRHWSCISNMVEEYNEIMEKGYHNLNMNYMLSHDIIYKIYHLFGVYNRIINARKILGMLELVQNGVFFDSVYNAQKTVDRIKKLSDKIREAHGRIEQRSKEKEVIDNVSEYYKWLCASAKENKKSEKNFQQRNYARLLFDKKNGIPDDGMYGIINRILELKDEVKNKYEKCSETDKGEYDGIMQFLDSMENDLLSEFNTVYELYGILKFYYDKMKLKNRGSLTLWSCVNKPNTSTYESVKKLEDAIDNFIKKLDGIYKDKIKNEEVKEDSFSWWKLNIFDVLDCRICCFNRNYMKGASCIV